MLENLSVACHGSTRNAVLLEGKVAEVARSRVEGNLIRNVLEEVVAGLLLIRLGQLEALIGGSDKDNIMDGAKVIDALHGLLDNVHASADIAVPTERHDILIRPVLDALLKEGNELRPSGVLELCAKFLALLRAPSRREGHELLLILCLQDGLDLRDSVSVGHYFFKICICFKYF